MNREVRQTSPEQPVAKRKAETRRKRSTTRCKYHPIYKSGCCDTCDAARVRAVLVRRLQVKAAGGYLDFGPHHSLANALRDEVFHLLGV